MLNNKWHYNNSKTNKTYKNKFQIIIVLKIFGKIFIQNKNYLINNFNNKKLNLNNNKIYYNSNKNNNNKINNNKLV